jgi:hypothetical protein
MKMYNEVLTRQPTESTKNQKSNDKAKKKSTNMKDFTASVVAE